MQLSVVSFRFHKSWVRVLLRFPFERILVLLRILVAQQFSKKVFFQWWFFFISLDVVNLNLKGTHSWKYFGGLNAYSLSHSLFWWSRGWLNPNYRLRTEKVKVTSTLIFWIIYIPHIRDWDRYWSSGVICSMAFVSPGKKL
jgi:hypothetical protein